MLYPARYKGMKKAQKNSVTPNPIKAIKSFNSCAGNFFSINPASYQAARSKKMWTVTDNRDVHPYCENASNPYHKCAEYYFHNVPNSDQPGQAMMMAKEERGVVSILQREMNSSRENMSDSYIEYNIKNDPEKEQPGLVLTNSKEETKIDVPAERWVNPDFQFASNPYHACAEYCLQNDQGWERYGHVKKLRSLKKIVSNKETSVHLRCKFAINPSYECGAECFQNKLGQTEANGGVDPKFQFTSNPYHICAEYCIQNVPEMEKHGRSMKLNNQLRLKKTVSDIETTNVHPCFASNSYHACNSYFFQNELDQNVVEGVIAKEKNRNSPSEKSSYASMENSTVNLEFSEPSKVQSDYAEFSEGIAVEVVTNDLIPEVETKISVATNFMEETKIGVPAERWVNPDCQFASNPYHACAEYCLQNDPGWKRHGHVKKLRGLKKIVSNKETSVHLRCKFASNPYHECGAECFQNKLEQSKANGASMKLKKENNLVVFGETGVDPKCQFASNPYHLCAEYCIQNVPEMEKHGRALKLKNRLKLKKTVSDIETTNVHPCLASNSYHACNSYFIQNELDQNIVEGVIAKEKNRNSPSEKSSYASMENSTVNLEFSEASQVQSDYAEFSEGIAVEVVANDLIPEVETKITKETSDVQLLQLDASDLFLEWAKYCSREKIVEFKIVKQAERRACETKNGQAHLKYCDSSNLEKVKAQGSLQLSISTSILFLLGFLFALFRWTQMIHSLCLQKGRRVMHKRH